MDQTQQQKGNFVAYLNPDARSTNKLPVFERGRIARPGSTEEHSFKLWPFEYTDKTTGELLTGFAGQMDVLPIGTDAKTQIAFATKEPAAQREAYTPTNVSLKPGAIVLFVHKPMPHHTSDKPKNHYGYANFGDDGQYVEIASWDGLTRNGKAMISGNTQYPMLKDKADDPVVAVAVDAERAATVEKSRATKKERAGRG